MYDRYLGLFSNKGQKVFMLPVPYECTVSYRTGTREGPLSILRASYEMESWDEELEIDISEEYSVEVLPFFEPVVEGPEVFIKRLKSHIQNTISPKDFLITLGGEHTVSLSPISFYKDFYKDMIVIQMDAHADLRDSYQQSRYSHACVMRRVWEMGVDLIQVGIRSLSKEESIFIKNNSDKIRTLFAWEIENPKSTVERLLYWVGRKKVYLTFDVDVLDPSVLPGTGTPEPGGLDFVWVSEFFKELFSKVNLIGFDVCELSPIGGEVISESVIVRIINRILTSMAYGKRVRVRD